MFEKRRIRNINSKVIKKRINNLISVKVIFFNYI